ncbi:MAG TPA: thiamine pyrophosphate-binding protein [Rhizobiales bacterium]|nr:thiamine pyrophosphate-binding protein [Hyphomicrobiales bacterium]
MVTASDIIAQRLYDAGCRHAFGIPGGEVLVLMEALDRAGIKIHLVKHENCAGFMGEGVFHFDGAPAILIATIGPGIANGINVIANALQDRVPMIALTGCVPSLEQHSYTHQVLDHLKLAQEVTKAAFRVVANTAAIIADKAVAIALEDRQGPVLLDVPIDVQKSKENPDWPRRAALSPIGPAAGADLDLARNWFGQSEKPVVIAGVDVLNQNGAQAVAQFCRDHSIPLITTYKAKGILPETDSLALGGAGLAPSADAKLLPLVKASDCIILAGYDPIEMRMGWQNVWGKGARVIEFSAVANHHYMHQAALNFVGNVAAGLAVLAVDNRPKASWPDGEPQAVRAQLRQALQLDEDWGPAAVIDECRKALPDDTIVTVDSGAHRILLSQAWQCLEPRGMLQSSALCTMGCAVPLAAGRKIAEPSRPVAAFVGDAGVEMFLGELSTIREEKLGIPIIVFVDESLGLIELKQRGSQMASLAVDFGGTDLPAVAKAMGGYGSWCDNRNDIRREVSAALDRDSFTLIAARIGRKAYEGRL